jgi:hypothetical protein
MILDMEPLFGGEEIDADDPGPRLREELELRARWLSTLGPEARGELVNTPIAQVEARFAAWRDDLATPVGAEAPAAAE